MKTYKTKLMYSEDSHVYRAKVTDGDTGTTVEDFNDPSLDAIIAKLRELCQEETEEEKTTYDHE